MANWHVMQKRKREIMDTPLQEDIVGDGQSHGGPKNMDTVLAGTDPSQAPGGMPMYSEETGPTMMSKGPKDYDINKGSHAHPHQGGAMKGDQSKTKKDYSDEKGNTDPKYKGKDGSSKGDQSASRSDYKG